MTSYEVVKRAIEFGTPDRLPVQFGSLGVNDFHSVRWNQIGVGDKRLPSTVDEWGCGWMRSEVANMGQVKGHPLGDPQTREQYQWPDPDNPLFYEGMEDRFEQSDDKYVTTSIFMLLFERMQALLGFEKTLEGFVMEREWLEAVADRIVEFDIRVIENISSRFPGQIHGLNFTDDWGTQQHLMIRPKLWEDFFRPRYKQIFDVAHQAGWHTWMHSCGKVNGIIGSLIEIGLDVIELQQPQILGIETIGEQFRRKICFSSLCDIQQTLPFKSDEEIFQEAKLLLENWATPQGGFILIDYGDGTAIGVSLEKKQTMLQAFLALAPWKAGA